MGACNGKPNKNHYHYEFIQKPIIGKELVQNDNKEPPSYNETLNKIKRSKCNRMIMFYTKRQYNYYDMKALESAMNISPEAIYTVMNILYKRDNGLNNSEADLIIKDIQSLRYN